MGLVNNNISPLPFYDDISFQNHRKDYAYNAVYPLVTYRNFLLPFQIIVPLDLTFSHIEMFDIKETGYVDITQSMVQNGLVTKSYTDFKVISYPANLPINEIKKEGQFYLRFFTNKGFLYSDVFTVKANVDDYAILEYRNYSNFTLKGGIVDFSNNFKFRCFLNTQIGKPDYNFEEEATERLGYSFIESQISKKVYKFNFLAPEFLCDALRLVRLCEEKTIRSKKQVYDLITFEMTVDWQDQGDLASVNCEFETDTVIANFGGREHVPLGGEYDSSYNNDYTIGSSSDDSDSGGSSSGGLITSWLDGYFDKGTGGFRANGTDRGDGTLIAGWHSAALMPSDTSTTRTYLLTWPGQEGKKIRMRSFPANTDPYGSCVDNFYVTVGQTFTVGYASNYFTINVCEETSNPAVSDSTVAKISTLSDLQNISITA